MNKLNTSLVLAAGIGVIAGLRAFTPAAIVSQAARHNLIRMRKSPLRKLRSAVPTGIVTALAVGELVGDKVPFVPNRIEAGPLAARVVSGALCGAVLCGAPLRSGAKAIGLGALLGGLGAVAGSFGGYHLRRQIVMNTEIPDAAVAVVEDMLAIGGAIAIVSQSASVVSFATRGYF